MSATSPGRPARIAVFASGGGTNFQALLDHFAGDGSDAASVALLITDRDDAGAIDRARAAAVAVRVIENRSRASDDVAREMLDALDEAGADMIALAGYVRLVPADVVRQYAHRIVNIHPALLPAFGGKGLYGRRVHAAVLDAGCRVSGATVHFVDDEYDTGRILAQWPVPVLADDTPEMLAARVLRVEHVLYPFAVERLARAIVAGEEPASIGAGIADVEAGGSFSLTRDNAPGAEGMRATLGLD